MTTKEAAAMLNGREYGNEITREEAAQLRAAGLVAVFGASDDLMEFRGAIDDEVGAYHGAVTHLTNAGLLKNDCEDEDCPYFEKACEVAQEVEAHWCPEHGDGEDLRWLITTDIPHETFRIYEDGELFCIGIVFALADARPLDAAARAV